MTKIRGLEITTKYLFICLTEITISWLFTFSLKSLLNKDKINIYSSDTENI